MVRKVYIVNHVAGFSRCTAEIQEKMIENIAILQSDLSSDKPSSKVSFVLSDLRDLASFYKNVSIALFMSQHLDSLFIQKGNLVLLQRFVCGPHKTRDKS